jgi:hypothetical protein
MIDWRRERTLSQVAKEVLIKAVAQALLTYVMSVFKVLWDCVIHYISTRDPFGGGQEEESKRFSGSREKF